MQLIVNSCPSVNAACDSEEEEHLPPPPTPPRREIDLQISCPFCGASEWFQEPQEFSLSFSHTFWGSLRLRVSATCRSGLIFIYDCAGAAAADVCVQMERRWRLCQQTTPIKAKPGRLPAPPRNRTRKELRGAEANLKPPPDSSD